MKKFPQAMKRFLALLVAAFCCFRFSGKEAYLLTCNPGDEVYEAFGHSALMLADGENGKAVIYNYGVFSFDEPHFIWKFILGQTNYQLGKDSNPNSFFAYYRDRKTQLSRVSVTKLQLSQAEISRLDSLLAENLKPENRTYLYNYFYDNCATRIFDALEKSVGGEICFGKNHESGNKTYRQMLCPYVGRDTWLCFGVDLLLGAPVDKVLTERQQLFLPLEMNRMLLHSTRCDGAENRLLALPETDNSVHWHAKSGKSPFSPNIVFGAVFFVVLFRTIVGFLRKKRFRALDAALFSAAGLAGCVVCFVSFFSIHPAVFPNYVVLCLHPLHLLGAFWLWKGGRAARAYAALTMALCVGVFAVDAAGLQRLNPAFLLVAGAMFLRAFGAFSFISKNR